MDAKIRISRQAAEAPNKGCSSSGGTNDATTVALAEGIARSESALSEKMNQMAQELGLTQSSFRNAHGLTEYGHYSTAKYMAKLFLALDRDFKREFYMLVSGNTTRSDLITHWA